METFINIFLFPYTALVFMFKYAIAAFGWIGIFMLCHYFIETRWYGGFKFRNPFYRD